MTMDILLGGNLECKGQEFGSACWKVIFAQLNSRRKSILICGPHDTHRDFP